MSRPPTTTQRQSSREPCLYEVTFRLDLNGPHPEGIVTPEVNSDYFGWCGSCVPMEDANGDGVWEVTVSMAAGQYLWKFSADNWTYQELPVGVAESPCFIFDEFGYVNRPLNVQGPMALPPLLGELPALRSYPRLYKPRGNQLEPVGQLRSELQHSRVSRLRPHRNRGYGGYCP